jgi:hypothetical protein
MTYLLTNTGSLAYLAHHVPPLVYIKERIFHDCVQQYTPEHNLQPINFSPTHQTHHTHQQLQIPHIPASPKTTSPQLNIHAKCVSPATLQSTPSAPTKTAIKSSPLTTASPTTAGHLHTTCPSPLIPTTTNSAATISPFFKTVPRSTSGHQRMEISAENATHCGKRRRSRE